MDGLVEEPIGPPQETGLNQYFCVPCYRIFFRYAVIVWDGAYKMLS